PGRKTERLNGRTRRFFDYVARGAPFGLDDGTIAPAAILGSLPFAPASVLRALRHVCETYPQAAANDRLSNGFNPTFAAEDRRCWVSEGHLGLDQGIAILMIENHRSRLIWNLMRKCPHVALGLRRA